MYKDLHIAVFGDYMLDQWLEAEDIGICPGQAAIDFKNPVIKIQKPGGAGNQAMSVASLGAKCTAYLAYGGREHGSFGRDLEYFMRDKGVVIKEHIEGFFQCHIKRYFMQNNQLLFRTSDHHSVYGESIIGMAEDLIEHITDYDGVIIADYNKGVCTPSVITEIMNASNQKGVPVFVDPKFDNWEHYCGAIIFKCNRNEFDIQFRKLAMGGKQFTMQYKNLVITDSSNGLKILNDDGEQHIPSVSGEVYDINGAGDSTMVAMVLEYLRTDGDILKAAHIGNMAGGICVEHKYTYQVTVEDLRKRGAWDE